MKGGATPASVQELAAGIPIQGEIPFHSITLRASCSAQLVSALFLFFSASESHALVIDDCAVTALTISGGGIAAAPATEAIGVMSVRPEMRQDNYHGGGRG